MRQRLHGSVWDLMHRPSKMNVYSYQTHLESTWFRGEAGLEKNLNLPKWIFGSVPTFAFKMMMIFLFFLFFLPFAEVADGGTWTGERGKINWLQWDSRTTWAPFVWISQSSTYTAVWILVVLFTPLPDASHCLGSMRQGSLEMWFFFHSFILSLFSFLLNLWMCLTEALDLLRGFLALHFGSMLKCQPRNAVRIGKYEFGAAKLYKKKKIKYAGFSQK